MKFEDPMLDFLVNKVEDAVENEDVDEVCKYLDVLSEAYPEVALNLMDSIGIKQMFKELWDDIIDDYDLSDDEEELISEFNDIVDFSDNLELLISEGILLITAGYIERGMKIFDDVLENNPDNLLVLSAKADAYELIEEYEKAKEINESIMNKELEDTTDLLIQARLFGSNEMYEKALANYDKALENDKNNCDIIYLKGSCLIFLRRYEESIKLIKKAIELTETQPKFLFSLTDAYHDLGVALKNSGKKDEALKFFNKVIKDDPEFYIAYYNIGNIYEDKENYKKALEYYNEYLDFEPYNKNVLDAKKRVEKML